MSCRLLALWITAAQVAELRAKLAAAELAAAAAAQQAEVHADSAAKLAAAEAEQDK